MLLPKRVKYRRVHRGRMKGQATRGTTVDVYKRQVQYRSLDRKYWRRNRD